MNLSLEGSVALVTGAAGHLGTEMVRQLAAAGARVAAADLTVNERLTGLVADVTAQGGTAIALRIDITDTDSVTAALQQIGQQLGPLDILVNNAGVIKTNNPALPAVGSFYELDEAVWKPLIDVNLCGTMRCTQLALRGMVERRRGRIINLASIAGVSGLHLRMEAETGNPDKKAGHGGRRRTPVQSEVGMCETESCGKDLTIYRYKERDDEHLYKITERRFGNDRHIKTAPAGQKTVVFCLCGKSHIDVFLHFRSRDLPCHVQCKD